METEKLGITVVGQGKAFISPDRAVLSVFVTSEGKTAQEARKKGDASMTAVFAAVKDGGIDDKDMQTGQYSVQPNWTNNTSKKPAKISGYTFTTSLAFLIRKLDAVPDLIDAVSKAGGNMSGLSFQADPTATDKLENQALQAAIKDAKDKADLIAAATGVGVGKPLNITHSINHYGGGKTIRTAALRSSSDDSYGGSRAAVAAGDQEISMSVTILYEIMDLPQNANMG